MLNQCCTTVEIDPLNVGGRTKRSHTGYSFSDFIQTHALIPESRPLFNSSIKGAPSMVLNTTTLSLHVSFVRRSALGCGHVTGAYVAGGNPVCTHGILGGAVTPTLRPCNTLHHHPVIITLSEIQSVVSYVVSYCSILLCRT